MPWAEIPVFTLLLLLAAVFFAVIERIRPFQRNQAILRDQWQNDVAFLYFNSFLTSPVGSFLGAAFSIYVLHPLLPYRFFAEAIASWHIAWQLFAALLILDVVVYVRHRFMHEYLWSVHITHHTPEEINWLTQVRLHPLESIIAGLFSAVILHLVGFGGTAIATASGVLLAVDIFNHMNINLGFPKPLCYLLASPNYHKWHHAKEAKAINKNYVVLFPFLDVLGGSYYCPTIAPPKQCGVFDRGGYPAMPSRFIGQLCYPFVVMKNKLAPGRNCAKSRESRN